MPVVPAENPELFTNAYASAGSSRFMVKGCGLWKFEEIVMFTLNLRGDDLRDPKNNSLVIRRLITVGESLRRLHARRPHRSRQRTVGYGVWGLGGT